jgi:hypothetical protein
MPRYELSKTIEARKLNPRSGLPLTEPAVSVPFGAILEKVDESWDLVKFTYLGLRYQCPTSTFQEAARVHGSAEDDAEPVPATASPAAGAAAAASPSPKQVQVRWEELSSSQGVVARAKLPGGWLVSLRGSGLTFYPDPDHAWDGKSLS